MDYKDRIRKLLALGTSPNENEAREALLKARQLMAEHHLTEGDIDLNPKEKVVELEAGALFTHRKGAWREDLASAISGHYRCEAVIRRRGEFRQIVMYGFQSDAEVCKAVYEYAVSFVEAKARDIKKMFEGITWQKAERFIHQYGVGFAEGVYLALEKQNREHQEYGLVLVVPQEVKDATADFKYAAPKRDDDDEIGELFRYKGMEDGRKFSPHTKLSAATGGG